MKKVVSLMCSLLLLSSIFITILPKQAAAADEAEPSAFLKTDGKKLRTNFGTGDEVVLRGTNAGSWLVQESWMGATNAPDQRTIINTLTNRFGADRALGLLKAYEDSWWQEIDFDNVKELGMNTLRLPFGYFEMLNSDGTLKATAFDRMDWFVQEAGKRGLYVILDMHAAPGSQNGKDHSGDISIPDKGNLFKNEENMAKTVFLWEKIADRYKGNPTIASYDLLNEPGGALGKEQWDFYDRLYKAIRAVDPDHTITIEAIWEPYDLPSPDLYGWKNVIYSYHFYGWSNTNSSISQKEFTNTKVPMVNEMTNYDVPLLVGEFSLFSNLQSWDYALNLYEEQGWSWTTWSYKTVNQGSWGLFNGNRTKVNINTDSYETILDRWSNVDTKRYFPKNHYYADLIGTYASPAKKVSNKREMYQDFEKETVVAAGSNATASVSSEQKQNGANAAKLVVTGNEIPNGSRQYVSLKPQSGETFNVSDFKYLIINGYNDTNTARTVYVTFVDKDGKVSSTQETHGNTTLLSKQWSKTALLLNNVQGGVDLSAIKEVRIGMRYAGTYYFDDVFFGQSFADAIPTVVVEKSAATLTGPAVVAVGDAVELKIGVDHPGQSFNALDTVVKYDPAKLSFATHAAAGQTSGLSLADEAVSTLNPAVQVIATSVKPAEGSIRIIAVATGSGIDKSGELFALHGTAKADAAAGDTTVSLTDFSIANELKTSSFENISISIAIGIDKSALNDAIAAAQELHDKAVEGAQNGQYPVGSKATLKQAIEQAQQVASKPTANQAEVEAAFTALQAAVNTFKGSVISISKGSLSTLILQAQNVKNNAQEGSGAGSYPTGSKATLQAAIDKAKAVFNDASATQAHVDQAIADLQRAIDVFKGSVIAPSLDKKQLTDLISSAQSKHDAATEGAKLGHYAQGSKAALQAAIDQAVRGLGNATSQAQLSTEATDLNKAVEAFLDKVVTLIPGEKRISIRDLALVGKYYGQTKAEANWPQFDIADINSNGSIDIQDLAKVANLILGEW